MESKSSKTGPNFGGPRVFTLDQIAKVPAISEDYLGLVKSMASAFAAYSAQKVEVAPV